jgi:hypothetical protein
MHPVHDVDALLLLALGLSAKRRPAELVDIMAATDLIQEAIPADAKLIEAFERLSRHGLIVATESGYRLGEAAEKIIAGLPRKAEAAERLFIIKDELSVYAAPADQAPIVLVPADVAAALVAHKAAAASTAKNLLVPKPKAVDTSKSRPGQRQRKPMPARRRKD